MKHLKSLAEAQDIIKALSTPARVRIMELLFNQGDMHLNELAQALSLTNSAITLHTKMLAKAGLIELLTVPGKRGNMKVCRPLCETIMIDMKPVSNTREFYEDDIPIGGYSLCQATPTCGIATPNHVIGEFDNPRCFTYPERFEAGILWFGSGKVEYILPNHLRPGESVAELELSLEISSESPGYNEDFPSDIDFYLNDIHLGQWISPGDFGKQTGYFTPSWWPRLCNQYGLLKTLSVRADGVYLDNGDKISSVTVSDLNITYSTPLILRLEVAKDTVNCGGMTLFGKGFGNYNQNIVLKTYFEPTVF